MSEENQNRNNRPRNNGNSRNRNRSGGNGGQRKRSEGRGGQGGTASQARNELQPPRSRRKPKPKPLTFWQKVGKALGFYKDPNEKPAPAQGGKSKNAPQGNKLAKGQGRVAGGGRVDPKGGGDKKRPRPERKPREEAPPTVVSTPRLYVGNLSYDATEYDLEELFKGVGSVRNVELVYNRHTHKSKGYGFVTMGNVEEGERAVEVLHDQPFMGRKMIVNGARSKGPADGDKEGRPRRNSKPANAEPKTSADSEIPAEEEVHSLSPKED